MLNDVAEVFVVEVLRIDLFIQFDCLDRLIVWQYVQERFALVAWSLLLSTEMFFKVKDASLVVLDFICSSEPCILIDFLLHLVNFLHKQE